MRSTVRIGIVVTLAAVMLCLCAGAAFGTTNMNFNDNSAGYAHWVEFFGSTGPIPAAQNYFWINHPVWYWNFGLTDSTAVGGITVTGVAYQIYPSSTQVPLGVPLASHPATLYAEGFYTLTVTGSDTPDIVKRCSDCLPSTST